MDDISPNDLKTILHSKRANLYYLEHCRVLVNGGRVEYVTERAKQSFYWNIPIANTTCILLGTGTSVTQAAMREMAKAGVLVGFCGGGGTPLFSAVERTVDIEWLQPQSEYRPTEYLQHWVRFWFHDELRLSAAKAFQLARLKRIEQYWLLKRGVVQQALEIDAVALQSALNASANAVQTRHSVGDLLTEEARLTKHLYKLMARASGLGDFTRMKRGEQGDIVNGFLDHGNYLAYGLAATAAWVLGLPHGLAVLHGKTRRGGLVFDIADLIKDAVILPQAFISGARGDTEQQFRQACIESLTRTEALDFMIDTVKAVCLTTGQKAATADQGGNE